MNKTSALPSTPTLLVLQQVEQELFSLSEVNFKLKETLSECERKALDSQNTMDESKSFGSLLRDRQSEKKEEEKMKEI